MSDSTAILPRVRHYPSPRCNVGANPKLIRQGVNLILDVGFLQPSHGPQLQATFCSGVIPTLLLAVSTLSIFSGPKGQGVLGIDG